MTLRRKLVVRALLIAGLGLGAVWMLAMVRATTRQAVDFHTTVKKIPLYAKAIAFVHRDVEYRLLAREITAGLTSEPERVLAVFEWTRQHIRQTPTDWPVVDDHVWHIIIRGHGLADQMADVFTTLSTYAGVPAFWKQGLVILSFARVEGRWRMFDVANGLVFTDAQGHLADVHELFSYPQLIRMTSGSRTVGHLPYDQYVVRFRPFHLPPVLRAEQQMTLPRLLFEARRLRHADSDQPKGQRGVLEGVHRVRPAAVLGDP